MIYLHDKKLIKHIVIIIILYIIVQINFLQLLYFKNRVGFP